MKRLLLFLCIFLIHQWVAAQAKQDKYGNEIFEGGFTSPTPSLPPNPNKPEPILLLLKYDNRDIMTGNECVREETIKMGFEYLVLCNKRVTIWNRMWIFCYNFGTNFELTFRNGFGWRGRLNQKIVECRRNSGDFVW